MDEIFGPTDCNFYVNCELLDNPKKIASGPNLWVK